VNRLDDLDENSMVTRLKRARENLDSLKNSQRAGSDNVVVKRLATGNTVDFITTFGYHDVRIWELTITPSDQTFPNSSYVWHIFWVAASSAGSGTATTLTELLGADSNGVRKARLYIMGTTPAASLTWGIRYVVYAIGNATLSIVQIA
jgi:hypothetical protein